MQRKPLVAANWKMNPAPAGWNSSSSYKPQKEVEVVVFPSAVDLQACIGAQLNVGAQCARPEPSGAFTGDLSMSMVKKIGCQYVLCGHSERRQNHGETNVFVALQVETAIREGLHPILCVGETEAERKAGKAQTIIHEQIEAAMIHLTDPHSFTIAYEPVWAIGTGVAASSTDAEEMHAFIRSLFAGKIQPEVRILYGGSVKPENAKDILSKQNIDGALVGNASLKPEAFGKIVEAAL